MDSKIINDQNNQLTSTKSNQTAKQMTSFAAFNQHQRKPSGVQSTENQGESEESAPDFEQIMANADKQYKSNEQVDHIDAQHKTLIGGGKVGAEHHRIVASQDMRHQRTVLPELEISQIREETNSKEGTSQMTRMQSNFLGSATNSIYEDQQMQMFLHRKSMQSQQMLQAHEKDDDELLKSESAPDFNEIFQ